MGALDGRTAVVTGAGRGIGAAISVALDAAGARVALVARSVDELGDDGRPRWPTSRSSSPPTSARPTDRAPPIAAALDAFGGRLDVLVNNAGTGLRKDSETLTVDEMDLLWNVNVRSALLATGGGAPGDARRRAGLDHLDQLDLGPARRPAAGPVRGEQGGPRRHDAGPRHGVRATRHPRQRRRARRRRDRHVAGARRPGVAAEVVQHIPTRRTSTPEEVADAVVFLASDASRAITGEVLVRRRRHPRDGEPVAGRLTDRARRGGAPALRRAAAAQPGAGRAGRGRAAGWQHPHRAAHRSVRVPRRRRRRGGAARRRRVRLRRPARRLLGRPARAQRRRRRRDPRRARPGLVLRRHERAGDDVRRGRRRRATRRSSRCASRTRAPRPT